MSTLVEVLHMLSKGETTVRSLSFTVVRYAPHAEVVRVDMPRGLSSIDEFKDILIDKFTNVEVYPWGENWCIDIGYGDNCRRNWASEIRVDNVERIIESEFFVGETCQHKTPCNVLEYVTGMLGEKKDIRMPYFIEMWPTDVINKVYVIVDGYKK